MELFVSNLIPQVCWDISSVEGKVAMMAMRKFSLPVGLMPVIDEVSETST
jgi:hypothetical protein